MDIYKALQSKFEGLTNPWTDVYFHKDFDGVFSALPMKRFLSEIISTRKIKFKEAQYGEILNQTKPRGKVNILVDFGDGFDNIDFHTDHHEETYSTEEGGLKAFYPGAKSNAGILLRELNKKISNSLLESLADAADCIDSAGFADLGYSVAQQRRFLVDGDISLGSDATPTMEHYFALNKVLGALKGKKIKNKRFLEAFLEDAESFHPIDLLHNALRLAGKVTVGRNKRLLFPSSTPKQMLEEMQSNGDTYAEAFRQSDVPRMTNGVLYCYNGDKSIAPMWDVGSYDRYVPFEAYPETDFLIHYWDRIGLIQVSVNPSKKSDVDLEKLTGQAIAYAREEGQISDMRYFKQMVKNYKSADDLIPPRADLMRTLLGEKAEGVVGKQLKDMSWDTLQQYTFDPWVLIENTSGGHKAIANIANVNALGDRESDVAEKIIAYITKELS